MTDTEQGQQRDHFKGLRPDGFNSDAGRTVDVRPDLEAARDGAGVCPEQAIQLFVEV